MSIPVQYTDVILGLLQKSQKSNVVWNTTTDTNTFTEIDKSEVIGKKKKDNESSNANGFADDIPF